tara:strand:- start:1363 stop:1542 length:180 start_codon:yes stop_codon:yes gene_type:complete
MRKISPKIFGQVEQAVQGGPLHFAEYNFTDNGDLLNIEYRSLTPQEKVFLEHKMPEDIL